MFHRPRHHEIPVPVERDASWVDVPVAGEIGHGFSSVATWEAHPNGIPGVTAEVHALFPVQPGDVAIRELIEDPVHHVRIVPGRDERALAGSVRPDLVKPHDEPGAHAIPSATAEGARDGSVRRLVSRFEP